VTNAKGVRNGRLCLKKYSSELVCVLAEAGDVSCPALALQFQHLLGEEVLRPDRVGVVGPVSCDMKGAEQPSAAIARLTAEVAGPRRT